MQVAEVDPVDAALDRLIDADQQERRYREDRPGAQDAERRGQPAPVTVAGPQEQTHQTQEQGYAREQREHGHCATLSSSSATSSIATTFRSR